MLEPMGSSKFAYRAFISYTKADHKFAQALFKRLEGYKLDKDLAARVLPTDLAKGRTIGKIYRAPEEAGAATSLPRVIESALRQSEHLIVVCSQAATQSRWVEEEIRAFRRLRPDGKVLSILVGDRKGVPAESCFPAALLEGIAPGEHIAIPSSPLAPDVDVQGVDDAVLRLIAECLPGVRYDDLHRRDLKARAKRRLIWTLGFAGISTVILAFAIVAVLAAIQAVTQRDVALRGQSEMLAVLAHQSHTTGADSMAARYAMRGLPSDSQPRPYVWQAAVALSEAYQQLREVERVEATEPVVLFAPRTMKAGPGGSQQILVTRSGLVSFHSRGGQQLPGSFQLALKGHKLDGAFHLTEQDKVVAYEEQGEIHSLSLETGRQLTRHMEGKVDHASISSDGRYLILLSGNSVVELQLEDLSTAKVIQIEKAFTPTSVVCCAAGGDLIVSAYQSATDKYVLLRGQDQGKLGQTWMFVPWAASDMQLSPQGTELVLADMLTNAVALVSLEGQGKVIDSKDLKGVPTKMTFSSNGQLLAAGSVAGDIHVWQVTRAQDKLTRGEGFVVHEDKSNVESLFFDAASDRLMSASRDGAGRGWLLKPTWHKQLLAASPSHVLIAPDSDVWTGGFNGDVQQWRLNQGRWLLKESVKVGNKYISAVAPLPGQAGALIGMDPGHVLQWSGGKDDIPRPIYSGNARIEGLVVSGDKRWIAITSAGQVLALDPSGSPKVLEQYGVEVARVMQRPQAHQVVVLDAKGRLHVYDTRDWRKERTLSESVAEKAKADRQLLGAVSSDGRLAWAMGPDQILRGWNLRTGILLGSRSMAGSSLMSLDVASDGSVLCVQQGRVNVYGAGGEQPLQLVDAYGIDEAAFTQSGQVATLALSGQVRMWDAKAGKPQAYIDLDHDVLGTPDGLYYLPESKQLLVHGMSRLVSLPDLPLAPDMIREVMRQLPPRSRVLSAKDTGRMFLPPEEVVKDEKGLTFFGVDLTALFQRAVEPFALANEGQFAKPIK